MKNKIDEILSGLGFSYEIIRKIRFAYNENNRHYHTIDHILEMLEYVEKNYKGLSEEELICLRLAIIFHDIVYDTTSKINEELSVRELGNAIAPFKITLSSDEWEKWEKRMKIMSDLIMATKEHNFSEDLPELTKIMIRADLERMSAPFENFWEDTLNIMNEYCHLDWEYFKKGRMDFLKNYGPKVSFLGHQAQDNINISYHTLSVWKPRIAVICGSFDPFTKGHERVVDNLRPMFDKVIIARGQNTTKPPHTYPIPDSIKERYQIDQYSGSIVDYLNSKPYDFTLIRGIRDVFDLAAETTLTRWIKDKKKNAQVLFIPTDPDVAHVSSTIAREERKINGNVKTEYEV